jgi:cytochrome P450
LQFKICIEFKDVIGGGTKPSATVLEWALAELMKNPGVMKTAQTKIRQQLQGHESVTESDLVDLNIVHLIIKETMRLHPPGPLLLPRECRETCNILGYDIPKGTTVVVNAWAMGNYFHPRHYVYICVCMYVHIYVCTKVCITRFKLIKFI